MFVCFPLIFSTEVLNAQNTYNQTDKQGRRQGKWLEYYENGQVRYCGRFKNDMPSGEFLYYSEDGKLIAKNKFTKDGHESESEMYAADGKIVAKGNYFDKKKNGKWCYFSDNDGSLILVEHYDNGLLVGKSVVYAPGTSIVVEEIEYVKGRRQGRYNKFYDNGVPMIEAYYQNDCLEGDYVSYYPNGIQKTEGRYHQGKKTGAWKTYDLEGHLISTDNYENENYEDPNLKGIELY